jgi:hypothetical protein
MPATSHEFKLVIDGLALDDATLQHINSSLQKAFLVILSELNLRGSELVYTPVMLRMLDQDREENRALAAGGGGSTGGAGVQVRAVHA